MKSRRAFVALCLSASPCAAQRTVHSAMIWMSAFGDNRFAPKTALYWDVQVRRADFGENWQQLLGTLGVTRELSPHWKVTAALGGARSYRYGGFPSRSTVIEVRPWLQLGGSRAAGSWTWIDRSRIEFRMTRPVGEFAPADPVWNKTVVRVRRLDKFQHSLTSAAWYGVLAQELLVNVAPAASRVAMLEQMRWQTLLGHQLSARNRVEAGYGLQRINKRGGYEMNHTLLLNFRTSVALR
jgi:hypothetical protein